MALPDIKKIPPQTILEFRNTGEWENFQIPEIQKNRKCTDVAFVIFFGVHVLVVIVVVAVSGSLGTDYNRFLNGYDKCGDTCGSQNEPIKSIECSGKDLTDKPLMLLKFTGVKNGFKSKNDLIPDICISECNWPNQLHYHRCIPFNNISVTRKTNMIITFAVFRANLKDGVDIIILPMIVLGLVFSLGLYLAFYYSVKVTVFSILALHLVCFLCFMSYIWYRFAEKTSREDLLYIAIASTITIFFLCAFICYFSDRYKMMIEMFNEATDAIFKMPSLIALPFAVEHALIIIGIVVASTVFLCSLISTNQSLKEIKKYPSVYEYEDTRLAEVGISFLILTAIWITAIMNGCQCFIVAGAVTTFYFERNKSEYDSPVSRSIFILFRYHFGTVVFGSLCITIVTIARIILDFLEDHTKCKCSLKAFKCLLVCMEDAVDYLTKRAYIQTAMHGKSLYKSGVRATRLLWANLMDTISLDVVGDFIMACTTLLIILMAVGIAIIIHDTGGWNFRYFWSILTIGAAVAGFIVYFFTQIINVAVETVFLCYCEDKLVNDGKTKPYLMSDRLKNLIDEAKKAVRRRES